jgi:hypothetical protein
MGRKFKDITGNKYGLWTALSRDFSDTRGSYWVCKCECGNIKSIRLSSLEEGGSESCALRECKSKVIKAHGVVNARRMEDRNQVLINIEWSIYRSQAKLAKREFCLSKEEFTKLITSDCRYCLNAPNRLLVDMFSETTMMVHGVDRVDSNSGYTKQNCVSCCLICNRMKNALSIREFKSHIGQIHTNLTNF